MKDQIKKIRTELNMTQGEFGTATGKNRDIISNYEQGRVKPDETFIMLLYEKYGYDPEWIRTGRGESKVQTPYWEAGAAFAAKAMQGDVAQAREWLSHYFDGYPDEEVLYIYSLVRKHFPDKFPEQKNKD